MKPVVLVADDERDIVSMVSEYLMTEGYEVWEAENGTDALELALKGPDLIQQDVMMPGSTLTSLEEAKTEIEQSLSGIRSIGYGLIALITIIGALGIINTTLTGLHTRRVDIGTLQAIGMSSGIRFW
ncbi:response regulator [Paenibacillus zanthoxyli]|uniref:response regulator n=1 Tax=Paenibacillus zanthoxyli TaxID=369399 RepID=UPI00046F82FF|nr:response regulator [Paenibacillus zanthoxyli]